MSINAFVGAGRGLGSRRDAGPQEHVDILATGMVALFGGLGPFCFGFDVGVSPGALRALMMSPTMSLGLQGAMEAWQVNLLPAMSLLGALAISFLALSTGNWLGRRTELLLAAFIYGVSSVLCRFATSLPQLLCLRALYGVAVGVSMHSSPPYLAETCPAPVRGLVFCAKEGMIVAGILKGYMVSSALGEEAEGWRGMYVAAAPVAALMAVGVWLLPESPRWLLLREWRRARAALHVSTGPSSSLDSSTSLQRLLSAPTLPTEEAGTDSSAGGEGAAAPVLMVVEHGEYELAGVSGGFRETDRLWRQQQQLWQPAAVQAPASQQEHLQSGRPPAAQVQGMGEELRWGPLATGSSESAPCSNTWASNTRALDGSSTGASTGTYGTASGTATGPLLEAGRHLEDGRQSSGTVLGGLAAEAAGEGLGGRGGVLRKPAVGDVALAIQASGEAAARQGGGGSAALAGSGASGAGGEAASGAGAPGPGIGAGGEAGAGVGTGVGAGVLSEVPGTGSDGEQQAGVAPSLWQQRQQRQLLCDASPLPHEIPGCGPGAHASAGSGVLQPSSNAPGIEATIEASPAASPWRQELARPDSMAETSTASPPWQPGMVGPADSGNSSTAPSPLQQELGRPTDLGNLSTAPSPWHLERARPDSVADTSTAPSPWQQASGVLTNSGNPSTAPLPWHLEWAGPVDSIDESLERGSPLGLGASLRPSGGLARAALERAWGRRCVHRPEAFEREMQGIAQSAREASLYGVTGPRLLAHPLYYRSLAAGILLMAFAQVTGQPAVMYESRKILNDAGVTQGQDLFIGAFRLVMTVIAAANVDVWGRRPLLLLGASGIVLALASLAAAQWEAVASLAGPEEEAWISVVCMLFFLGFFQVSFGPISWLYVGEIFPLAIRGPAIAAANIAGFSCSLAVQLLLPYLHDTFGTSGIFVPFTLISLCAVLAVHAIMPETKGKTLEEIELQWGGERGMPSNWETASLSEWLH